MKQLYRSRQDRIVAGVCGGLAIYFNRDPLLFRILFVALTLMNGIGVPIYLLLWIFLPPAETAFATQEQMVRANVRELRRRARELGHQARYTMRQTRWMGSPHDGMILAGAALVGLGLLLLLGNLGLLAWLHHLWPLALIVLGILILIGQRRERV